MLIAFSALFVLADLDVVCTQAFVHTMYFQKAWVLANAAHPKKKARREAVQRKCVVEMLLGGEKGPFEIVNCLAMMCGVPFHGDVVGGCWLRYVCCWLLELVHILHSLVLYLTSREVVGLAMSLLG